MKVQREETLLGNFWRWRSLGTSKIRPNRVEEGEQFSLKRKTQNACQNLGSLARTANKKPARVFSLKSSRFAFKARCQISGITKHRDHSHSKDHPKSWRPWNKGATDEYQHKDCLDERRAKPCSWQKLGTGFHQHTSPSWTKQTTTH